MKKGQVIEGIVQRVDFPNKGIVACEEGTCVVKNALPGQKVKCAVNKVRKGKAEGRLLEVTEASPLETGSPCPHFGSCGGCTYISLPYEEQLRIKEEQVKKLLDSVLCRQGDYQFEGIKASPVCFGYRNKMEFSFGDEWKDGPLSLGMHKRGSFYDVVSVTDCQIVDEDYRKILRCVREYFTALQEQGIDVKFYHRLRHIGYLRHLLVRKAAKTGEILIALVTTTQLPEQVRKEAEENLSTGVKELLTETQILDGMKQALLSLSLDGRIVGILHTRNDAVADVVKSDETNILYGQDYFYEELLGLKFKISQFSFFQTNSRGAEVLYQTAREYISGYIQSSDGADAGKIPDKVVFDLYSGTGTIAQLMAPVAKKVIGVEIVEEAVEAARKNTELNGLQNCEFIAGDVLKVLDTIEEKPDIIILDPPRDGIHPKALDKIIRYGVDHILYISCKPTSLVRDLEVFLDRGYRVDRAVAVDQFPWTANVETVVLLSQRKADDYVEVELELDELDDGGNNPFVINSAENNGIGGHCSLPFTEKGNIITFSDTTDGNTFFYQPDDFIGFAHVQGMHPLHREWNKYEMLFITSVLMFHNKGLFNYGRKMRRDVISKTMCKLPIQHNVDGTPVFDADETYSDDGYVPDWKFMEDYIKSLHSEPITTKISGESVPDLDVDKWEVFYLKDLFVCCMGNGIDASATTNDAPVYNYVSRDSKGNGVVGFVDVVYKTDKSGNIYEEKPFNSGTMTLALGGSFLGSCFVQKEPYYTAQNVAVLTEKESLSLQVKIFISTLIRNECKYKYLAFGRELNTHYKTDFSIKLPIQRDDKGNPIVDEDKKYSDMGYIPDWQFMEDYMKSLPYCDRI